MATPLVCTPRTLSAGQRATATSVAASLGFESAAAEGSAAHRLIEARRTETRDQGPAVIAMVKSVGWGKKGARLTTAFMDTPSKELRREILRHLNMWSTRCNVQFVESAVDPMVRISRRNDARDGGFWSYLGKEILGIDADEPTMNLEGFTMRTPPSEFRRVVCHEAGHTLGFPHEHMRKAFVKRIDPEKAYAHFLESDGWSKKDVDEQVLASLSERTLIGTPSDQTSIMCYQLPGSITFDGKPILGGTRINETDYRFAARVYPLPTNAARKSKRPAKAKKRAPAKRTAKRRTTKRTAKAKRA